MCFFDPNDTDFVHVDESNMEISYFNCLTGELSGHYLIEEEQYTEFLFLCENSAIKMIG